jgi:endonuclease YncB( thermonuclease family)
MILRAFGPTICLSAMLGIGPAFCQANPPPWFPIPTDAIYETGDTWTRAGKRYRLYGVQACLRGTSFTNERGVKRDCGEASLAMLVSLIRDLKPLCYAAATLDAGNTVLVFCFVTMPQGQHKGARIDLGTALISIGFGFASIKLDGQPVHAPYSIAEAQAKNTKSGLWAYADMLDPNSIILQNYKPPKAPYPAPAPVPSAGRKSQ